MFSKNINHSIAVLYFRMNAFTQFCQVPEPPKSQRCSAAADARASVAVQSAVVDRLAFTIPRLMIEAGKVGPGAELAVAMARLAMARSPGYGTL